MCVPLKHEKGEIEIKKLKEWGREEREGKGEKKIWWLSNNSCALAISLLDLDRPLDTFDLLKIFLGLLQA